MASLDQMEGDAVETAVLLLVVLIVMAIILAGMGSRALLDWLLGLLHSVELWFSKLLHLGGPVGSTFNAAGNSTSGFDQGTVNQPADQVYNYLPDWLGGSPDLTGSMIGTNSGVDQGAGVFVTSMQGTTGGS
jgi:hypothetical protein